MGLSLRVACNLNCMSEGPWKCMHVQRTLKCMCVQETALCPAHVQVLCPHRHVCDNYISALHPGISMADLATCFGQRMCVQHKARWGSSVQLSQWTPKWRGCSALQHATKASGGYVTVFPLTAASVLRSHTSPYQAAIWGGCPSAVPAGKPTESRTSILPMETMLEAKSALNPNQPAAMRAHATRTALSSTYTLQGVRQCNKAHAPTMPSLQPQGNAADAHASSQTRGPNKAPHCLFPAPLTGETSLSKACKALWAAAD